MKKILSTLAASAILAGTAAAADVSLEFTQGALLAGKNSKTDGTPMDNEYRKLDLNGYMFRTSGDVTFSVSTDDVGVTLTIDPYYEEKGKVADGTGDKTFFSEYYGWVNFFEGQMQLKSGVYETRSLNLMDDGGWNWLDDQYARYKPGVVNGSAAEDIANLTNGKLAMQLSYETDSIYVAGAVVDADGTDGKYGAFDSKAGFAFEFGVAATEDITLSAYLRTLENDKFGFGLFMEHSAFTLKDKEFDVLAGLTLGQTSSSGSSNFEWALDLRAQHELSDTVTLTTMHNLSSSPSQNSAKDNSTYSIWDMASVAVQTSEEITVSFTVEWEYTDLTKGGNGKLDFFPSVTYSPCEGVDLSGGLIIKTSGWSHANNVDYAVPVVLHVAL